MRPPRPLRVLIYAPHLLPVSQPWIRQHAELLPRFDAALAGRKRASPSLHLGTGPRFCLADARPGPLPGARFLLTGRNPDLESFVRRFQPQLIHAHFAPGATEIIDVAALFRLPLVVSCHGWDAHIPPLTVSPYARRHLLRRPRLFAEAALVLAASQALRDRLLALGAAPARTEVHYLGVDRALFDGARRDDGGRRIAIVGRLVRSKGVNFAIEAFRRLHACLPGVELAILGDGPERRRLEALAAGLPVRFLGVGSQADARALLATARVACLPSTTRGGLPPETLGLAAAEAQAMGVPVVATATGGIPEVVLDGATGLLVPDADPAALAAALERLLTNDALHARMRLAGQRHVAETFDARRNLDRLAARYEALLGIATATAEPRPAPPPPPRAA